MSLSILKIQELSSLQILPVHYPVTEELRFALETFHLLFYYNPRIAMNTMLLMVWACGFEIHSIFRVWLIHCM